MYIHRIKIRYEWDEEKSFLNFQKHGITFDEAKTVFLDRLAKDFFDEAKTVFLDRLAKDFFDDENSSDHEDRFLRIGTSDRMRILAVVFCERGEEALRIISARKATARERSKYERRV